MSDQPKFRITLWDFNASGWRGTQKAVVYNASSIGVEEKANDVGSAFWTLANDNPQIAEFVPLERHYEIARWNQDASTPRWEFVAAGILNDYSATEFETTFAGLDYKSVMNQVFTPLNKITFGNVSPLNPNLATVAKVTVFNQTDGSEAKDQVFGTSYDIYGKAFFDVTTSMTVTSASVLGVATTTKTVSVTSGTSTYTASTETPYARVTYSLAYVGATTLSGGTFFTTPTMRVGIFASPPAASDMGDPPVGNFGRVAEFNLSADSSSGVNRFKAQSRTVDLFPFDARDTLYTALVAQGAATSAAANALLETPTTSAIQSGTPVVYALRKGLTYTFNVYAAIYASYTSVTNKWFISPGPQSKETEEVTLGQGTDNVVNLVQNVFNNAVTGIANGRLRYASLAVVDGASTATTHTTYSAGQPSVDYIGDLCDLEMGARTDGGKVVFGINKPAAGSFYDGTFKLRVNVASTALTTGPALRYPETIKSYSFAPGYARVRNDITIVPTEKYLAGSTGQGTGANIIGATASNSASVNLYGRIPLVIAKGGFVNAQSAGNEASRMIELYGTLDSNTNTAVLNSTVVPRNTRQIGLRIAVDGIGVNEGWDVGDSINVQIKHGIVDINEPFVIAGYRWFGETDGHERLEMDLVQGSSFAASYRLSANTPLSGSPGAPSAVGFGGTATRTSGGTTTTTTRTTTTTTTPTYTQTSYGTGGTKVTAL